jgi:hypothetical protein
MDARGALILHVAAAACAIAVAAIGRHVCMRRGAVHLQLVAVCMRCSCSLLHPSACCLAAACRLSCTLSAVTCGALLAEQVADVEPEAAGIVPRHAARAAVGVSQQATEVQQATRA